VRSIDQPDDMQIRFFRSYKEARRETQRALKDETQKALDKERRLDLRNGKFGGASMWTQGKEFTR